MVGPSLLNSTKKCVQDYLRLLHNNHVLNLFVPLHVQDSCTDVSWLVCAYVFVRLLCLAQGTRNSCGCIPVSKGGNNNIIPEFYLESVLLLLWFYYPILYPFIIDYQGYASGMYMKWSSWCLGQPICQALLMPYLTQPPSTSRLCAIPSHYTHTHDTFCMYVLDSHSYPE